MIFVFKGLLTHLKVGKEYYSPAAKFEVVNPFCLYSKVKGEIRCVTSVF